MQDDMEARDPGQGLWVRNREVRLTGDLCRLNSAALTLRAAPPSRGNALITRTQPGHCATEATTCGTGTGITKRPPLSAKLRCCCMISAPKFQARSSR